MCPACCFQRLPLRARGRAGRGSPPTASAHRQPPPQSSPSKQGEEAQHQHRPPRSSCGATSGRVPKGAPNNRPSGRLRCAPPPQDEHVSCMLFSTPPPARQGEGREGVVTNKGETPPTPTSILPLQAGGGGRTQTTTLILRSGQRPRPEGRILSRVRRAARITRDEGPASRQTPFVTRRFRRSTKPPRLRMRAGVTGRPHHKCRSPRSRSLSRSRHPVPPSPPVIGPPRPPNQSRPTQETGKN